MNKKEKQIAMINGAVFKHDGTLYAFDGYQFVDCDDCDINNDGYKNMTLKTPPPKPEYSREFEIIPPHRMAYLMEVLGEVLEFEKGGRSMVGSTFNWPFHYQQKDGEWESMTWAWTYPCRVRQAPKMETRWQWLYKNLDGVYEATRQHYATGGDAKDSLKNTRPDKLIKIEESKDEFEVEEA